MAEISKITLPSGTTYDIKDAVARQTAAGGIQLKGTTTTALTDECTTNPITINGDSYTAVNQDAVFYGKKEFVFDGTKWHEFGDMSGLGALATKDSVSASYTPAGTVSQPSFTGSASSVTISSEDSQSGNYQPKGTVSQPTFTGSASSVTISASTSSSGNYTPAGSVSAPTISVSSAGSTASITPVDSVGSMPTFTVGTGDNSETLIITNGTAPSFGTAVTVKTGDASYEASQPEFTGTKVQLSGSTTPSGTVSQPTFTGTKVQLSGSTTPSGTVSQPSFTGTAATITSS